MQDKTIYQFTVKDLQGKEVPLANYKDKVLLIVNTATRCGEVPQLSKLESLYQKYKNQGFEVLGFPSNQFAKQEPLDGEAIAEYCQINYGVSFKMFDKVDVRGSNAHPVFQFFYDKKQNGRIAARPWWNYYKFLIDRNGHVVDYFITYTYPNSKRLQRAIEKSLGIHNQNVKPSPVL